MIFSIIRAVSASSYSWISRSLADSIVPTRVRKPKGKSAAEASVDYAETWIIAALRDRKFFTVRERPFYAAFHQRVLLS